MTRRIALLLLAATAFARAEDTGPRYFSARTGALAEVKARLAAGDKTLQSALRALVERADKALKVTPSSVTQKTKPTPSGNVHDYASTAPYFWPDPSKPDGLPYIAHSGKVNPVCGNLCHGFVAKTHNRQWVQGLPFHPLMEPSRHRLVTLLLCGKAEASPPPLLVPSSPPENHWLNPETKIALQGPLLSSPRSTP